MVNAGQVTASAYFMGTGETVDPAAAGKVCMIDRALFHFTTKLLTVKTQAV
ncbi:MAG: hypothetical protein ACI9H9_000908 [Pseudoalteromonas tetraodonis]|jgi:hypothetical protein